MNKPLIILSGFLVIFFLLLVTMFVSVYEQKGKNNEHLIVPVYFYSLDDNMDDKSIYSFTNEAREIWSKYNITITILGISHKINDLSDRKIKEIFNGNQTDCPSIRQSVNAVADKYRNVSIPVILVAANQTRTDGRAYICQENFIALNSNTPKWLGWNFAHELGHSLNVDTSARRYNLMIEGNRPRALLIKKFRPDLLNQSQINRAVTAARIYQ